MADSKPVPNTGGIKMSGLTAELRERGIRFVRFLWCDNANVLRAKVVPVDFLRSAYEVGVGISFAQQAVPAMRDAFVPKSGLGPVGEARLYGDWSSLVYLPYAPGHARVMGNMAVDGQPWSHCPRHFLYRMVQKAAEYGLQLQVAFENEFYLLKKGPDGPKPLDDTLFCSVHGLNQNVDIFQKLIESLGAQDCPVVQFHTESGGGQFELSVHHTDPMSAANQQITFRETVHAIAHQNDLVATFLPKPYADRAGSGCHIHMSLWKDGRNISDPTLEDDSTARHFIAGILKHLGPLMGLTTPTRNSFARIGPHLWSGAFSCWGYDNREASIRVPTSPAGISNFEFKTHDATANPYLALGGLIALGLFGIDRELKLADPIEQDPGLFSNKERKVRGIKDLPKDLKVALSSLNKATVLKEAMGDDLHRSYLSVKFEELKLVEEYDEHEEIDLLLQRY
jgi:glutamine synthetase